MRSTTGTAMVFGRCPSRSHVTETVAKGPLDRVFYALTKVAAHAKQLAGIIHVSGCPAGAVDGSDATAGIGITSRQSCDKPRHFEATWFCVQDEFAAHRLMVRKVPTEVTRAGLATKYLLAQQVRALLMLLNLQRVKAHERVEARFWYSDQVSVWELVQGLAVLVLMTVFCALLGGDGVSYKPQSQQHCDAASRIPATHPTVTTGAVVNTRVFNQQHLMKFTRHSTARARAALRGSWWSTPAQLTP